MIWSLLLVPALAAVAAFVLPWDRLRRSLLVAAAATHTSLVAWVWFHAAEPALYGWMRLDAASLLFLSVASLLFLIVSVYTVGYLRDQSHSRESPNGAVMNAETATADLNAPFTPRPEATFTACLLLFLATMTLVSASCHLGLMWVAVEATTLASAPLIYFHRDRRSLEATWKYLLICSVGIALALLGNFFLAVAAHAGGDAPVGLTLDDLARGAAGLDPVWLKAAFLLFLVGYGTKMGLAPLHTWLPDAHSEAPSPVSALLSGALLNCAFLAILRVHHILALAGLGAFSKDLLVFFGLLSMGVAAVFILGQTDFKRMLAYSSIEHMGILALGAGIGGVAGFGCLLHAANHSFTKGMLFLAAGNILAAYKTKSTEQVQGVLRILPVTGILWVAGFLAICGSPPFGPFLSELAILKGAFVAGRPLAAFGYLAALAVIFVGFSVIALRMAYSDTAPADPAQDCREPLWSILPPLLLGSMVLLLGVYIPPGLTRWIEQAAVCVGVL
jgi:hydrogenase-4 component F